MHIELIFCFVAKPEIENALHKSSLLNTRMEEKHCFHVRIVTLNLHQFSRSNKSYG